MIEEWRGVIYQGNDYSQYYEVSNFGRFRNARTHKILKQTIGKTGYYGYCGSLGSRQKKKIFKIHRAVAETFIKNPNNYEIINHIDGNKLNNNIINLEWCTQQYNYHHAVKHGLMQNNLESLKKTLENKKKKIYGININTNEIFIFSSIIDAAIFLGDKNKHSHISEAINGKRNVAYGYKWKCL